MKDRTLLLAGLVEEDDFEITRQNVVESYEKQLEDDRKNISEQVSFIEDDETRLIRLIGEQEEEPEWEGGANKLNENIAMGGYGPGFAGAPSYALSARYSPSQSEAIGQIVGGGYHRDSKWADMNDPKIALFQKIAESNPGAFQIGMQTINEDELPEFDENFNPILSEMSINMDEYPEIPGLEGPFNFKGRILYYDPKEGKYYDRKSDMYVDNNELSSIMETSSLQEKLHNGDVAVMGGIGPGFEAFDGIKKEIKNPYGKFDSLMSRWYLGEMKEQPDLPGELEDREIDYFDDDENEEPNLPSTIVVDGETLRYVGKDMYEEDFHLYEDDGGEVFGVAKDGDGWYAAARSDYGTEAEGFGNTPEEALNDLVAQFYGKDTSDSLLETVEGTDGNKWFYRRTGTPDDYYVRFREDGEPTMHPEAPEEPSSKGHPGLTGWHFYDADHTKQKMDAKMNDIFDDGEADAEDDGIGVSLKEIFGGK